MPIVRRGAPINSSVGTLQGMSFPTVEGRLRLGYLRGGRGGVGLYLPIDPTVPNPAPVVPAVHGVGAIARRGRRGMGAAQSFNPVATITNLSGGSNSAFKVGDAWRIDITGGPPNACVYLNASIPGVPMPYSGQQDLALSAWLGRSTQGLEPCGIGTTDAGGNYSTSGVFGPGQVGIWRQSWNIQGNLSNFLQFTVADTSGSTQYGGPATPGGTPYYTQTQNNVPTQPAPTAVVQTLADELAGRVMLPSGQIVASAPASSAPPATSSNPASGAPGAVSGAISDLTGLVSGFSVSSVPVWGWIAAAGVGALLLFGGHKH